MNKTPDAGWYYVNPNDRAAAWTGVEYLHRFLTGNKAAGPMGVEVDAKDVQPGDIAQLSFDGKIFGHTPFIVAVGGVPDIGNIMIAAHTYDCDNRPISTYDWAKIRFIHITGVNRW